MIEKLLRTRELDKSGLIGKAGLRYKALEGASHRS